MVSQLHKDWKQNWDLHSVQCSVKNNKHPHQNHRKLVLENKEKKKLNKNKIKVLVPFITPLNQQQAAKTRWLHPHNRETKEEGRTRTISFLSPIFRYMQPQFTRFVFTDCHRKPILPSHSPTPEARVPWANTTPHCSLDRESLFFTAKRTRNDESHQD